MKYQTFIFIFVILEVYSFQQSDYRIIHERMNIDFYNTNYLRDFKATMFHYKRYEKRFNFSGYIVQDLGMDITNTAQAYKFQSNEYREFPVLYKTNACLVWKNDLFGLQATHMDTNVTRCPIKRGFYYGANVYIDDSKLPPYAPRGRYMLDVAVYYKNILIGRAKWYGAVEPTNPLEHVINY